MKNYAPKLAQVICLCSLLMVVTGVPLYAQKGAHTAYGVVEGIILDAQNHAIPGARLSLDTVESPRTVAVTADSNGHFRFKAVPVGSYSLRATLYGYQEGSLGPFSLQANEVKSVSLLLTKLPAEGMANDTSNLEFKDEPAFTVAGVTDTTALGGHGSDRVLPNSNALAKDAASLAHETAPEGQPNATEHDSEHEVRANEASLRAQLAQSDSADLRAQLADIEERDGRPFEAVKDYQRAAEMQPSEPHLFSWGAELLLHRAVEPAIEVFSKGRRLYPQSSRMLLGLGAAKFAEGSKERAEQIFLEACDLNPSDPTPYLFLGRIQATENFEPLGLAVRMKRFVSLHPENAKAHYLYAVALTKQGRGQDNTEAIRAELKTAIQLDPHFGDAYLQLGILCSQRDDLPGAVSAFQKVIENSPLPEEAHYRLAQIYRRQGEAEKARQELAEYQQISEQKKKLAEQERHEIQQFVYTLRGPSTSAPQTEQSTH